MSSRLAAEQQIIAVETPRSAAARWYDAARPLLPGLALVAALGLAALGLAALQSLALGQVWLEALVLALLLGVLVRNVVPNLTPYDAGAAYAGKQVPAAAFPVSAVSGEVATMVKLGRVMLLGPLVIVVGLVMALSGRGESGARLRWSTFLPWFVLGFLVLAVLRNVGLIPDPIAQLLRGAGGWLIVLAMAGLGLGVRLSAIRSVGPRVACAVIVSLASMIGLTLFLIRAFAIDAA